MKVTVPCVTGLPALLTVAVKVTVLLGAVVNEGFSDEVITVAVGAAATAVVMVMLQPPEIVPPITPPLPLAGPKASSMA
jgi:hypothetical protein